MLDNGRISSVQLLLLLIAAEIPTAYLFVPSITAREMGPDAWLSTLVVATVYGLAVALVAAALGRRFPSQVLTEYLPLVLGKIPGKLVAAAYALLFINITAIVLGEMTLFIHLVSLRETPLLAVSLLIMSVAVYTVYKGIEVTARQNEIVLPVFLFITTLLLVLTIKEMSIKNLMPVLENGILPVVRGGVVPGYWRGEVFFLLMLYPYLNQKREALKTAIAAVFFVGCFATLVVVITIGVFGDLFAARQVFPVFFLARYISLADILERLELYIVIVWIAAMLVKLAVFLHTSCIAAASTLGLKRYQPTIVPIALALMYISKKYYFNYLQLTEHLSKITPYYMYSFELLLPALVLLAAVIRKQKGGEQAAGDRV